MKTRTRYLTVNVKDVMLQLSSTSTIVIIMSTVSARVASLRNHSLQL